MTSAMLTERKMFFEQLGQLGGLGGRDRHHLVTHRLVQLGGAAQALSVSPPTTFGVVHGVVGAAGINPLGEKAVEEVPPCSQPDSSNGTQRSRSAG